MSAVGETIDAFRALDTEPYGVNEASAESHLSFIDDLNLPFDLLVDEGSFVSEVYGCLKPDKRQNARTVIIVGKNGKVIFRQPGAPTPALLLEVLKAAQDEPAPVEQR